MFVRLLFVRLFCVKNVYRDFAGAAGACEHILPGRPQAPAAGQLYGTAAPWAAAYVLCANGLDPGAGTPMNLLQLHLRLQSGMQVLHLYLLMDMCQVQVR